MQLSDVTPQMIADLRSMIDEPDTTTWDDSELTQQIIAADGTLGYAAYNIWRVKAASLSSAVDISEGGSSRKNSQAYAAAIGMASLYQAYVPVTDPVNAYHGPTARTRAIVRE